MIELIIYSFPTAHADSEPAFQALKRMLSCPQMSDLGNGFSLSTAPDLFPKTVFQLDDASSTIRIILKDGSSEKHLPQSLFSNNQHKGQLISFLDAEKELAGKIIAIDHTGIVTPSIDTIASEWTDTVNGLALHTALYDYPQSAEYDPQTSRWLFVIPFIGNEDLNSPQNERLRQPKFELVWDKDAFNTTVLQIDMETRLTRDEIEAAFPTSYELPGLGDFFRSVNVASPWAGIAFVRLDLRYLDDRLINDWNSAKWLTNNGERVRKNGSQATLPDGGKITNC